MYLHYNVCFLFFFFCWCSFKSCSSLKLIILSVRLTVCLSDWLSVCQSSVCLCGIAPADLPLAICFLVCKPHLFYKSFDVVAPRNPPIVVSFVVVVLLNSRLLLEFLTAAIFTLGIFTYLQKQKPKAKEGAREKKCYFTGNYKDVIFSRFSGSAAAENVDYIMLYFVWNSRKFFNTLRYISTNYKKALILLLKNVS